LHEVQVTAGDLRGLKAPGRVKRIDEACEVALAGWRGISGIRCGLGWRRLFHQPEMPAGPGFARSCLTPLR
jgi:hypothetical protein